MSYRFQTARILTSRLALAILFLLGAQPLLAAPDFSAFSGVYHCHAEQRGADYRVPEVRLDGRSGGMTVIATSLTSFSGMATRAYFGKLADVEYWLNWRAQSGLVIRFHTNRSPDGTAPWAELSLPDTLARFRCDPD